ncbi:hypothetical protein GIB67_008353 [Kingdonia uniflora]|uniref:mitogen-activated protein kinase kinase kinase n=1 Tax=Kingdonia uniflora TaxID=39325 RepID=A0A7J7N569_9MAGN|nr:hypothetical protein GIB67_008353 [Kingdonia uniflora]
MPSWWGKSSSKEVKKKPNKESFIDTLQRKFKAPSEEKASSRTGSSRRRGSDTVSEKGFWSQVESRSPLPSTQVSRCQSFSDRPHPHPLPLPGLHNTRNGRSDSGISLPRLEFEKCTQPSLLSPYQKKTCSRPNGPEFVDVDGYLLTASVFSDSSTDNDTAATSCHLSPQTTDCESGSRTVANSPSRFNKDRIPIITRRNLRDSLKPANLLLNNQSVSMSPRNRPLTSYAPPTLQIPHPGALGSAPDSSMSSPCRSPMRFGVGSSPGSGHNSGQNSMGGNTSGQSFLQNTRGSPEWSPIPSPRMMSPTTGSRIHSGAVTPLHPRAGGADDGKQRSHRLPLPPSPSNCSVISPSNSASTTISPVSRSPGRISSPTSPASRWKKGRLLGRGTFGHVYVGFDSESGEMCAMKEVTLISDDAKSKESAKQLGQEITLLSRLRHQNIVQYYGTETVDDKLYIYLEYVSGGSIYKLLQDYGQLGEFAIRSYTQQILSGLAYLHSKNTIHRDIKGANLLVDPNGRVKLADFGMAKHITGQSCPLSLKGSPYWMAPEVIKNSNGCGNLSVDIWSLGCTVLEMATTKPPWSQYEGVPAMFKIGNSKELPVIPEHLSCDGKDFVRQCLQRNPLHRPTAAQLLEHPFIRGASPIGRPIVGSDVSSGARSMGIGHARNLSSLDSEGLTGGGKYFQASSDTHTSWNISCPVSPMGSPPQHPKSPHYINRRSPSPISSPCIRSGSSTPLTTDCTIPILQEGFHRTSQSSQVFHRLVAIDNYALEKPVVRPSQGREPMLAGRASQQLVDNHDRSILARKNGT